MKNGIEFIKIKNWHQWVIYKDGQSISASDPFLYFDDCEQNIRSICSVLYPHTIENQVVTEAVERFKKENKIQ